MPIQAPLKKSLTILHAAHLSKLSWLVHGFSTRHGGCSRRYGEPSLNLGFTKDDTHAVVERNRSAFLREVGALGKKSSRGRSAAWPLVTLQQIHSDLMHFVDAAAEHAIVGDGLLTATPGLLLAVQTADCLPIILADPKHRAVSVFHAGWRGTVKRIVEKGVGEMHRQFGSDSADLKVAIGPGIHGCCYEVGEEVREKFESQFSYAAGLFREQKESDPVREKYPLLFMTARPPGHSHPLKKIFLDMVEANRRQLIAAGVPAKNIEASSLCTNCRPDLLFSYRAEKGKTGRMMGVVGIRQ